MVDLRSEPERRLRAAALLAGLLPDLRARARGLLGDLEGEAFVARLEQVHIDVVEPLDLLFGHRTDIDALVADLVGVVLDAAADRPLPLRCWTGAGRWTPAGSSGPGWSATPATRTASTAPSPASGSGWTTWPSSA